jgi:hypothetical protein
MYELWIVSRIYMGIVTKSLRKFQFRLIRKMLCHKGFDIVLNLF